MIAQTVSARDCNGTEKRKDDEKSNDLTLGTHVCDVVDG